MYYIECKHCGHFNEVKSEYLTFCSKCKKKLDNNYSSWKRKNPEASFDDYKAKVCVTNTQPQKPTDSPKPPKKKGAKYWIGFAISFAILVVVSQIEGDFASQLFSSGKTSPKVLEQSWVKETYGFGLTVETPEKMIMDNLELLDNIKQLIEQMNVYSYMSKRGFKVFINSIKYKPVIGQTNLQGAADGSVNEMKNQKGVTDFVYKEEAISNNDIPGFIQKGTFKQKGIEVEFFNTGFTKDLIFWQVTVIYMKDDDVGRIAAQRVIDSIDIK